MVFNTTSNNISVISLPRFGLGLCARRCLSFLLYAIYQCSCIILFYIVMRIIILLFLSFQQILSLPFHHYDKQ
jgi:hypothetical protein